VAAGNYSYLLGGDVKAGDVVGGLTGTVAIDSSGIGYLTVTAVADNVTDGDENMTITIGGQTSATVVRVLDTSKTPAPSALIMPLTTGVDTTLVGGAANDTYNATNTTLTAGDNLNGGDGADTLNLTSILAGTYGTGVTMTSVETVNVTATIGAATFDASGATGVTTVASSGSTADVAFTNLAAIPAVNMTGTSTNLNVGMVAAATAGRTDVVTVTLNGAAATGPATLTMSGIETMNVATTGSNTGNATTGVLTLTDDALSTLNITGTATARLSAALVATATAAGTITSDAGAHDVTFTVPAGAAANVNMGDGNDTVRISSISALQTIAGGLGTDRLVTSAAISTVTGANVSGFETVQISGGVTVALPTAGNTVSTLTIADAAGGTLTGFAAAGTVNLTTGGSATVTNATGWTGTTDSITVNVGATSGTGSTGALTSLVSADLIDTATLNNLQAAGDTGARSIGVSSTTLRSVVVGAGGSGALTITGGGVLLTSVDASAATGAVTFPTSLAAAGASLTGGSGADVITGGAGADNLTGGAGNDNISGGAGNDTISGGDGVDTITGGAGADNLTGGAGADVFVFASNATTAATPVVTSTNAAPDTITDFVSGTDKISITGAYAPVAFLGNFTNVTAALAAQASGGIAYRAAYVTGENSLYVFQNTNGTLNVDDMVIRMPSTLTSIAAGDLYLGSQGSGNSITLSAASANVTSSASTNAAETTAGTNTPIGSANTTDLNDTVASRTDFLSAATIAGGNGLDTLALSLNSAAANATITLPATITGFETITLANYTPSSTANNRVYNLVLDAANVNTNTTLTITSNEDGLQFDGSNASPGVTVNANALAGSQPINFTGAAAFDVITGGSGNDTINGGDGNDTIAGGAGSNSLSGGNGEDQITSASLTDTIDGGAGNDTIITSGTYTGTLGGGAGVADILSLTATSNLTGATLSGFETLNFNLADAGTVFTIAANQLQGFTDVTRTTITAANTTIAVTANTSATIGAGTLTADNDVTVYTITGATGAGLTVTPGTAAGIAQSITGGAGNDIIDYSSTTATADQTLIGGAGDDTVRISGATFTNGDTVQGGTGTDTLEITGNTALTITLPSGDTGFEVISITGATSAAISITVDAATLANSTTMRVSTSQTTGALTFNASAENTTSSPYSVTGGGGDDVITGGVGNDTLTGGAGSDTLVGGSGIDSISSGTGNNVIDGGVGNDVITLDVGADTIRLSNGSEFGATGTAQPTTVFVDTVSGWGQASDFIVLGSGNLASTGTAAITFSNGNGADIAAGAFGAGTLSTAALNATVDAATATSAIVRFTSTTSTSFASAIGSGSITIANFANNLDLANNTGAAEAFAVIWYDSTNSRAVLSAVVPANGATSITSGTTTVYDLVYLTGVTTTDYGNIAIGNFAFQNV
jgi:Ca2+-binding RTX toxin-like protein